VTDRPAPTATLAGIALLSGLDEPSRRAIERRCRWQRVAAGEQIIDRHSDSRDVYFVVEGSVRVVNYSLAGREITFDEVAAGGHFGELAAIDGAPRSATVVALAPTLVAVMPASVFAELLSQQSGFALRVMRDLTRIIRTSTERIMDLSTLGAHNRVYAEILRLARPQERGDNSAVIRPIPVHGDIASRVSTTRETVARVFGELARRNILKREHDALVVSDVARLADMVEQFKDM